MKANSTPRRPPPALTLLLGVAFVCARAALAATPPNRALAANAPSANRPPPTAPDAPGHPVGATAGDVERLEAGPKALDDVGVDEHLGGQVPLQLDFVASTGESVRLSQFITGLRPVLLTLNYADCPMLCNVQLDGLLAGLHDLSLTPGKDFEIVTISIDPNEQLDHTRRFKDKYIAAYERPGVEAGWHFLTGSIQNIEAVARAVGFKYTFVPERKEYAHTAVVMVLSPEGIVSRYLYGITFAVRDLRLAILEASEGKIGTTLDRILLYCFHYDATVGRYSATATHIMRLAGALTVILLGGTLGLYWLKEIKTKRVPRG